MKITIPIQLPSGGLAHVEVDRPPWSSRRDVMIRLPAREAHLCIWDDEPVRWVDIEPLTEVVLPESLFSADVISKLDGPS